MKPSQISPEDPRLTAYALGEMEASERVEFEQLLAEDAGARQAVEDIRALAGTLGTALEAEPAPASSALETESLAKAAVVAGRDPRLLDGGGLSKEGHKIGQYLRFPQMYFYVSGLAAACFALFFVYWQSNYELQEQIVVREIDLSKVSVASKNESAPAAAAMPPPAATIAGKTVVTVQLPVATSADEAVAAEASGKDSGDKLQEARGAGVSVSLPTVTAPNLRVADVSNLPAPAGSMQQSMAGESKEVTLEQFKVSGAAALTGSSSLSLGRQVSSFRGGGTGRPAESSGSLARVRLSNSQPAVAGMTATLDTESYAQREDNRFLAVASHPLSTFAIDVDTASYANVRRFLTAHQRPPPDAVRIEEMVNYFPYDYAGPQNGAPFAAHLEVASAPWAPEHRLVRIGLRGREVSDASRPPANLVFLLDVSGSMNQPNKLPLVQQSMRLLLQKLRPDDRVAIVTYAGQSGLALPSTSLREKSAILSAIDSLQAYGSTNGGAGIQLAYDIAKANFRTGGVNRVILATDGDFNVGVTGEGELTRLIEEKARSGVFLTVLGYGMGNYKDATLEKLADKGNGNFAYIDTLAEARKTLVEQAGGTLQTIAKDVKIQVEFNPAHVQAYRLIGYENRLLQAEDFNNDKVDAGEIGAGHTVTALYEVVPAGVSMPEISTVDPLKYQKVEAKTQNAGSAVQGAGAEMLTVKVRYKEPAGDVSSKLEFPLVDEGRQFADASDDFKFAAAVASFGMILRDSPFKGTASMSDVESWAREGTGRDPGGYRSEFLGLVKQAGDTHGEE